MRIPLNDLERHGHAIADELRAAVESVLASGRYLLGAATERFESDFAAYCGVRHAVGVANGTDALELALRALGCEQGDEIITVANAGGYATAAIFNAGARPVYADIDPATLLITADTFMAALTPATKAVIVTHLYGLMADMPALCKAAAVHGVTVIEDCAHAHGARILGKKAGAWGALGCFSFYPTKNLGALGDAGCVVANDDALAAKVRSLRQYGWQSSKYEMPQDIGRNSRMDELQAAVLTCQLPYLDRWNGRRRDIIRQYRKALTPLGLAFQHVDKDESYVGHLCVVRTRGRDGLMAALHAENIAAEVHYPIADYAQAAVSKRLGRISPLAATEQTVSGILSIPCFPEMTEEEVKQVIAVTHRHLSLQIAV